MFIFSFDSVQTGVGFDDAGKLERDNVLVEAHIVDLDGRPFAIDKSRLFAMPHNARLWFGEQLALEDELIAVIILPNARLLREGWRDFVAHLRGWGLAAAAVACPRPRPLRRRWMDDWIDEWIR